MGDLITPRNLFDVERAERSTSLISSAYGLRKLAVSLGVFSFLANVLMLTGPIFMLQIGDRVLPSRSSETLVALLGLVVLAYGCHAMLEFARKQVAFQIGMSATESIASRVFHASLEENKASIDTGLLRELEVLRGVFVAPVVICLLDIPWSPLFVALLFVFHPLLGWFAVAGGTLIITLAVVNQILTVRHTKKLTRLSDSTSRIVAQTKEKSELVIAHGMTPSLHTRWQAHQRASNDVLVRVTCCSHAFTSMIKSFRLFLQSGILGLGAFLVLREELSPGAMFAASIVMGRALAPIDASIGQWSAVQRGYDAWKKLRPFWEEFEPKHHKLTLPDPKGVIQAEDIIFVRDKRPILRGISFEVRPGEAMGVIGPSGSGKSTLARLLVGVENPSSGVVRLSGANIAHYEAESLCRNIGYVPQAVEFFDGSIAENIGHMELNVDGNRVIAAANKAGIHEFILDLPEGYQTRLGSTFSLSGGQLQRLALARALYHSPKVIILDEPNAAIDAEGTQALNIAVNTLKSEGCAVLVMTHRPDGLAACDRLLVLKEGRIAGCGPRDEILRKLVRNSKEISLILPHESRAANDQSP